MIKLRRQMLRSLLAMSVAVLGLLAADVTGDSRAEAAGRWRLDFAGGTLSHAVLTATDGSSSHYYLTYTVTNGMEEAREARIRIELRTDTDKTYRDRYDAAVVAKAEKNLKKEGLSSTFGLRKEALESGSAKEAIAVFGELDPDADELEVRVYGLWDPIYRDLKGRTWSERRVLVLKYERPGDEYRRTEDTIRFVSSKQEVEGEPILLRRIDKEE